MGRRVTIDLGSVAAGSYSDEADLSSFTSAVLWVTASGSSNCVVRWQFSPTEQGETAVWYDQFYVPIGSYTKAQSLLSQRTVLNSVADSTYVIECPTAVPGISNSDVFESYTLDGKVPRRVRLYNYPTGSDISSLQIEAHQRRE